MPGSSRHRLGPQASDLLNSRKPRRGRHARRPSLECCRRRDRRVSRPCAYTALTSNLSIRRPSRSTTSNRQPCSTKLSPSAGRCAERGEREAGDGRVVAVLGQVDAEPLGQRVGRHRARDQQRAVVALDHIGARRRDRRPTRTRRRSPRAGRRASRSLRNGRIRRGSAPSAPRRWRSATSASIASIWSITTGALRISAAQVERLAAEQRRGDVARLDDADHRVDRPFGDRQAACAALASSLSRMPVVVERRCRASRPRCAASSPRAPAGRRGAPRPR